MKSQEAFLNNRKKLTSDKLILKAIRGAHIETEDLDSDTLSSLLGEALLSSYRKLSNRN